MSWPILAPITRRNEARDKLIAILISLKIHSAGSYHINNFMRAFNQRVK